MKELKIEDNWISVHTCRYPKKEGNYLVTILNDDETRETRTAYFGGEGNWVSNAYWNGEDIIAWMKLPQPYNN